jgi:hypothetical protein
MVFLSQIIMDNKWAEQLGKFLSRLKNLDCLNLDLR